MEEELAASVAALQVSGAEFLSFYVIVAHFVLSHRRQGSPSPPGCLTVRNRSLLLL